MEKHDSKYIKRLNNINFVTHDDWVITLIKYGPCGSIDEHAMIAVEGKKNNSFVNYIIDLKAPGFKTPSVALFEITTAKPSISIKQLAESGNIKYYKKSPSYVVPYTSVRHMLEIAEIMKSELSKNQGVSFNLFGKNNLFNSIKGMFGYEIHSCITWAIELLRYAGINLSRNLKPNFFTSTSEILKIAASNLVLTDLFEFAVKNRVETIKLYYSNIPNINFLSEGGHLGKVETILGHYSPLMLAAAYGSEDVVRLFVEEFNADINLLGGRSRDYTALDCAKMKCLSVKQKEYFNIYNFLLEKGARSAKQQRPIIQKLCEAAKKGNNNKIISLMNSYQCLSVNQTVSDATFGLSECFLGVYSPLMLAVINKKFDTVKLLIETYGADPNLLNGRCLDLTALDYALESNSYEIINYLYANKALTGKEIKDSMLNSDELSYHKIPDVSVKLKL